MNNASAFLIGIGVLMFTIAAVNYNNEPRPLPLNAGMIGTNSTRNATNLVLTNPKWPRFMLVFSAEPAVGYDSFVTVTTNVIGTNYTVGFLDRTNQIVIGTFLKMNPQ